MTSEEIYKELTKLHTEITDRFNEFSDMQSEMDRQVAGCYHAIEFSTDCDQDTGYLYFLELKETLERRRVIKDEMLKLQTLFLGMNREMTFHETKRRFNKNASKQNREKFRLDSVMTLEEAVYKTKSSRKLSAVK